MLSRQLGVDVVADLECDLSLAAPARYKTIRWDKKNAVEKSQ